MEVVLEHLGHPQFVTMQQSYDKVVQRKVGDEMSVTNSRIHSDNKNGMSK